MTDQLPTALLSPEAAAARLGVTTRTLNRWVTRGDLVPAQRTLGGHRRFSAADVDALAARVTTP